MILLLQNSEPILQEPWVSIFMIIGLIATPLSIIGILFAIVPKLKLGGQWILNKTNEYLKLRFLEKKAIGNDIENTINISVSELIDELSEGWIHKVSIKWVKKQAPGKLKDGEMILRLRPMESQDSNLINGIYFFFSDSLFPDSREIIPPDTYKAAALQLSRRTIIEKDLTLEKKLNDEIIENEVQNDAQILDYLDNFKFLDESGFFTGSFLREIDLIAKKIRFLPERKKIREEIISVINHTKEFIAAMPDTPNNLWTKKGMATSYRFLLIKKHYITKYSIYVNRAKKALEDGIDHLYVLGSNLDKRFVIVVINHIRKIEGLELVETFNLYRDFRGKRNGIGALFITKKI
jgi:hypothetical protein